MKTKIIFSTVFALFCLSTANSFSQNAVNSSEQTEFYQAELTLAEATMCESVQNLAPRNPAVVFSISAGSVSCFTRFDPVPETTAVYHKWYKRDRLSTTQRLTLEPPKWRTYSSIYLREADKGPWRVEIEGPKGEILEVLRFSITE